MFYIIFIAICVLINGVFLFYLLADCAKHRTDLKNEPGNIFILSLYNFIVQFLAALGVSDYAIHMIVWRKSKWVPDNKLPGTMLCSCTIPQFFMAIAFITIIKVDLQTLIVSIVFSLLGCILGVSIVSKLNEKTISTLICLALLISSIMMFLSLLHLIPESGTETFLSSWKQVFNAIINFILAAVTWQGSLLPPLKWPF